MSDLNVLVLMAGHGLRFQQAGFSFPKPLIDLNGKPMIQAVIENIGLSGKYIFLVLKEHYDKYALKYLLPLITKPNQCEIIVVDHVTEGAACTALLAKELINNDIPLLTCNSDQLIEWSPEHFIKYMKSKEKNACGILTFNSCHPKWSFAQLDEDTNLISEVAEKKPISNTATCGLYYFGRGKDFVSAAEQMISKNIRFNNEFYLCPVFNEIISNNIKVYNYPVTSMTGLGTPEDFEKFIRIMEERNK